MLPMAGDIGGMLAALAPAGLAWPVAAGLLALSFATSFVTAAFGIGGGAILLAVLAVILPPAVLIPVHGAIQIGSNAGRAAILIRHAYRPALPSFVGGSLLGVMLGGLFAVNLPPWAVQIGVGCFILWSVFGAKPRFRRGSAAVTGAFSSFLTMFFGATGSFVAAYVKTLDLDRVSHVATHATFMTIQHVLKVIVFGILGFAFGSYLPLVAGMIATGFLGTVAGKAVLLRIDDGRFRLALSSILVVLALRLIYAGGRSVLGI